MTASAMPSGPARVAAAKPILENIGPTAAAPSSSPNWARETAVAQTGQVMPGSGAGWKVSATKKNVAQPPATSAPGTSGRRRARGL